MTVMLAGGMAEIVELTDIQQFRRQKRSGRGVVVMKRGGSGTSIHHPDCPFVSEDGFTEKVENRGRANYFWADALETARAEWPLARVCGHPSDPLAGGSGGKEATRRGQSPDVPSLPAEGGAWELAGPSREMRAVRAVADTHIPFEPRTQDLVAFRAALRQRLARLAARDDEVLHATYFGPKPANCDVENLLLYNVDQGGGSFVAGRAGVRFEYSDRTPSTSPRPVTYLYRPRPVQAGFALWRVEEALARWPAVELAAVPTRLAPLWLALRTNEPAVGTSAAGEPIAVRATLTPPIGTSVAITPTIVKTIIDAIVSALQAHDDRAALDVVSERLAVAVGEDASRVAMLLSDRAQAVLGTSRLVHLRGDGVIFAPSDEVVVAGEVLLGSPSAASWQLAAAVHRLFRRR